MTQIKNVGVKIIVVICVLIIIGQLLFLNTIEENAEKIKNHINDIELMKATAISRNYELLTIGQKIDETLNFTTNDTQYTANEILKGHKTLVYVYTQMECKICIESQIEILKTIFGNDVDSTSIVILGYSSSYKNLFLLNRTYDLKFPVFKIDEALNLPPDTLMLPYFLLVDEDLRIANAFITIKERMNYSIHYLKSMYRYFHSEDIGTNTLDITIDKKHIDLGNVKKGSSKTVRFTISNNTTQNIQLDVIPDCDCTTIDFGNGTLQAQEKRQITATIKFKEKGNFVKYIYVYYNGNQNPMEVEIRGNVN